MRKTFSILSLVGLTVLVSAGDALSQGAPKTSVKYSSERSQHKFAGATRVVLDNFDPMDKAAKSASLLLDNNDVVFSALGEPRVTLVFYKSFQVKLTLLNGADVAGKDRGVFAVELPKEYAAALGKSSLRLVAPVGAKSEPMGVRLLLLSLEGQVTDTLELRPARSSSKASLPSASGPLLARSVYP